MGRVERLCGALALLLLAGAAQAQDPSDADLLKPDGPVTLTAVEVAGDMGVARVLFVPFGDRHQPDEVQAGLARAAGFLRGEAGRRLGLRHAPRLDFVYDESIGRADRLTRLIDDAVRNDRADGGDDPRDSGRDP